MLIFSKKQTCFKIHIQKLYFFFSIFGCIFPIMGFANLNIVELLPNPTWDDTLGEYIEIRNTGCESINMSGYHLYDASNKTYIFPSSTIVNSHENIRLPYSTTKIALNNSGIESVTLTDSGWVSLDNYTYNGTQQDNIIILIPTTDENCEIFSPIIIQSGSITMDSGSLNSGGSNSWIIDTGSLIENNTGNTGTENTNSGVLLDSWSTWTGIWESIGEISGTGDTETGSISATGSSYTGSTGTGWIFPDIFPTLQQPTNALFSWGIFDCTGQSPCRINVTFDPIFTGWLLARDYICEVITDSGSIGTCNPNTLYFSTGGSFIFYLSKNGDTNQYREIRFSVIYNLTNDSSWVINATSWSISGSWNTSTTNSGVTFPDIIPVFQNYTNTTNSWDTLSCTTNPCRVNFTLDPIFTGAYRSHDYACEIHYGTGMYDCNPPQLYMIGTGSILIEIIHRSTGQKISKELHIMESIITPMVRNISNSVTSNSSIDTNPPILILDYDGKLKSYHEQIWDYEMNCYTSTCTINLSAERSYDPDWSDIRFLWYYWPGDIKISKDPGERKYWLGDHEIWLRVIDTTGNVASIRYHIHVLGEREEDKKEKINKKYTTKDSQVKNQLTRPRKQKKPKKIVFFDPPNILLQNSKFIETDNQYTCFTTTKNCSLNLEITGTQKWIIYTWIYDDGEVITSSNPRSKSFAPGIHTVQLIAGYSSDMPIWTRDIIVKVTKIWKMKKSKKIKKTKIVHNSISISYPNNENNIKQEQKNDNEFPFVSLVLIGGILPIIALRKFLTGITIKI